MGKIRPLIQVDPRQSTTTSMLTIVVQVDLASDAGSQLPVAAGLGPPRTRVRALGLFASLEALGAPRSTAAGTNSSQ